MPQPKPFSNSHAPAQPSEETEFPRFKKPVGALAEAASQEEKPVTVPTARARRRSARFLLGFMAGVLGLCNLKSGNSVGETAKLRLLGIPYSWSSIHPGGPIAPQET